MSAVPMTTGYPGTVAYGAGYGGYGATMGAVGGYGAVGYGQQQGTFYGTTQMGDAVIDRYVVPGETMHVPEPVQVPGVTTVMENQMYMEPRQHTIKVPRTVMDDVEVQYQVPAMESRFHTAQRPRTVMEEQTITVPEPRTVMEPVAVQVPHVQTVQAIQMHHKVVEYERPRMIPGRMVRAYAGPTQTVGYTQAQTAVAPVAYGATYGATTGVLPATTGVVTGSAAPMVTGAMPATYGAAAGYGGMYGSTMYGTTPGMYGAGYGY